MKSHNNGLKPLAATLASAALLSALALPASAQVSRNARYVPPQNNRTPVVTGTYVYTGPVTRTSGSSLTVNHNGILRPTALPGNAPVMRNGREISPRNLRPGETVRVTAVQVAPNRWQARRVDVVRPIVAGTRMRDRFGAADRTDRVVIRDRWGAADEVVVDDTVVVDETMVGCANLNYSGVGTVTSVNGGDDSFHVKIGNNTREVFAEYAQMAGVMKVRDLKKGDRVRVVGDLNGRDVFASRVEMLD